MTINIDDLPAIEAQGYTFVKTLIPCVQFQARITRTASEVLWNAALNWRQWGPTVRRPPNEWRCLGPQRIHAKCRAFFAGVETAIREFENETTNP